MYPSNVEAEIGAILDDLHRHLSQSLSVRVQARYPIDDIVHDTYVRALANVETLAQTNRASRFAWLRRTSHRLVIDRIRRKQSQQIQGAEASAVYAALTQSRQLTPSRECSAEEAFRALRVALAHLREEHQTVLKLRYFEQLPFAEVAVQMGRSSAAVRGLHRNAIQRLRHLMGKASRHFLR